MYRKYTKVKNRGFRLSDFAETGLVVQEKLDGANASFTYDRELGKFRAFSRNKELTEGDTLNGFYQFVQGLEEVLDDAAKSTLSHYTIYGEWLTSHKIRYKDEAYKQFYIFDVYSREMEFYLSSEARDTLTTKYIPLVPYCNTVDTFLTLTAEDIRRIPSTQVLEQINELVGKSNNSLVENKGEGIVVKKLTGKTSTEDYYKFVTDEFKETMGVKKQKPTIKDIHIVDYAVTSARLEKLIYKKVDEGVLTEEDLSLQSFGKVMGAVAKDFQDDILEEEMDELIKQMRQRIGRQLPNVLRPFLEARDLGDSDLTQLKGDII